MKTLQVILFHLFLSFFLIVTGYSQTIIFNDEAHGIWSKENSPYIVLRDITVPSDSLLFIEPGVEVQFATGYGMRVYGNLLAVGEDNDQIFFTSADTIAVKNDSTLGWNGITILGENTDTSLIENCVIEHVYANQDAYGIVQSAVNVQNRQVCINECIINENVGHYGGGIFCDDEANALISNSVISDNSGVEGGTYAGILIRHSNAEIVNNLIYDNGIGILILYTNENSDTVKVLNNTVVQNNPFPNTYWYANITILEALAKFQNCIIWNNPHTNYDTEELIAVSNSDYVEFENCIIPGGNAAFYSEYEANIVLENVYDIDPFFADIGAGNFQLSDSSYGINGGRNHSPDILSLMPFDLTGNPRIYDDNDDIIDIGAYEFQGTSVNRTPAINNPGTRHVLVSTSKEMVFSFSDGDADDTHTLSVSSNSTDIIIGELSSQTYNATYTIDPVPGWTGEADVVLMVTDNHGAQDIDTFKFVVSDTVNYTIDDYTVWDTDTVYIAGNTEVSSGSTLEIREGTCVQFLGYFNVQVYGVVKALGTPDNKIRFTSSDTSGYSQEMHSGWGGIRIQNNSDSSIFNHCILEYVKDNSVLRTDEGTA
ncbi:MAG: right-handed parallel beta-helix repeat-containing protein, partial [Bacteroidales bacterium]|nr:right-handed parallel beta-helix repeat-containing protein [Bacteroidales bacterium]